MFEPPVSRPNNVRPQRDYDLNHKFSDTSPANFNRNQQVDRHWRRTPARESISQLSKICATLKKKFCASRNVLASACNSPKVEILIFYRLNLMNVCPFREQTRVTLEGFDLVVPSKQLKKKVKF